MKLFVDLRYVRGYPLATHQSMGRGPLWPMRHVAVLEQAYAAEEYERPKGQAGFWDAVAGRLLQGTGHDYGRNRVRSKMNGILAASGRHSSSPPPPPGGTASASRHHDGSLSEPPAAAGAQQHADGGGECGRFADEDDVSDTLPAPDTSDSPPRHGGDFWALTTVVSSKFPLCDIGRQTDPVQLLNKGAKTAQISVQGRTFHVAMEAICCGAASEFLTMGAGVSRKRASEMKRLAKQHRRVVPVSAGLPLVAVERTPAGPETRGWMMPVGLAWAPHTLGDLLDPGALVTGHLCSTEPPTREAWRRECEEADGRGTDHKHRRPWNHDRAIVGHRQGKVRKGGRYVLIAKEWSKRLPRCHASIAKGVKSHALSMGRFGPSLDHSAGNDTEAVASAPPPKRRTTQMVIPRRKQP